MSAPAEAKIGRLLLAAVLCGIAAGWPVHAQEFTSNLSSSIRLTDEAGEPVERPRAGGPFWIAVDVRDAVLDGPATKLSLEGWIRPLERTNLPCTEAAQSFRATRRLPVGATDLAGALLLNLNEDASFSMIDPRLNLANANLLKAGRFGERPVDVATDERAQRAYFLLATAGEIRVMNMPSGDPKVLVGALSRPFALAAAKDGAIWVAERDPGRLRLFGRDGAERARLALDADLSALADTRGALVGGYSAVNGRMIVAERDTGTVGVDIDGPANARAVAIVPGRDGGLRGAAVVFLLSDGEHLDLRYLDDPTRTLSVPLPLPATRVDLSPDGIFLFAWDGSQNVSTVDLVQGKAVQAVVLAKPIREIAFAGSFAAFLYADATAVAVQSLSTIRESEAAQLREVRLGLPVADIAPDARMLVSMASSNQVLAVHRDTSVALVIDEQSMTIGAPPMSGVSLRGGVPHSLFLVQRGFSEMAPGRYVAAASIEQAGDYEVVLTTGIRGLTACSPIAIEGDRSANATVRAFVRLKKKAPPLRLADRISFDLVGEDGDTVKVSGARATVSALSFNLRRSFAIERAADGLAVELRLPHPGPYILQVDAVPTGTDRIEIAPLMIEVER